MNQQSRKLPRELETLRPIAEGLAKTFGRRCEVTVHDFSNPQNSLVMIFGNVTGRREGAPLTDRLLKTIREEGDSARDLLNLRIRTRDGKLLNSSSIFIRNSHGRIVGSLGINYDLTDLETAIRILDDLRTSPEPATEQTSVDFANDVEEILSHLIDSVVDQAGKPVPLMSREDKLELIRALDGKGVFLIKKAVEEVSSRLGISRYTVYNYLEEVRATKEETG